MTAPVELRERYLAAVLPGIPAHLPDLSAELARFVRYPTDRVEQLAIPDEDKALLTQVGLPESAAPFLSFGVSLMEPLGPLEGMRQTAVIGFNGSGDQLALDLDAGGAVVEFNHDSQMARTVMNVGASSLLHSLCAFVEWNKADGIEAFALEVQKADAAAAGPQSWWIREAQMALNTSTKQ